jgi:spore maturation protein CgeB
MPDDEPERPEQAAEVRVYPVALDFLRPFLEPFARLVSDPDGADLLLAMNSTEPDAVETLAAARRTGKPLAFWTVEDPNWFEAFLPQAALADAVFTTDEACLPDYRRRLGHDRVHWLPLACSPELHRPLPLDADAADLVVSANWYENEARLWAVRTVVDPLLAAGHSLALFCYETFLWPPPYSDHWRGRRHYLTTAEQYRHGRVVVGLNNQRSGLDGRASTVMTSMRTFEALACGKPLLAAHSDAYDHLGLRHGEHLAAVSTPDEARAWAGRLLGPDGAALGEAGRQAVLAQHTYAHRLARVARLVLG